MLCEVRLLFRLLFRLLSGSFFARVTKTHFLCDDMQERYELSRCTR